MQLSFAIFLLNIFVIALNWIIKDINSWHYTADYLGFSGYVGIYKLLIIICLICTFHFVWSTQPNVIGTTDEMVAMCSCRNERTNQLTSSSLKT